MIREVSIKLLWKWLRAAWASSSDLKPMKPNLRNLPSLVNLRLQSVNVPKAANSCRNRSSFIYSRRDIVREKLELSVAKGQTSWKPRGPGGQPEMSGWQHVLFFLGRPGPSSEPDQLSIPKHEEMSTSNGLFLILSPVRTDRTNYSIHFMAATQWIPNQGLSKQTNGQGKLCKCLLTMEENNGAH